MKISSPICSDKAATDSNFNNGLAIYQIDLDKKTKVGKPSKKMLM